MSENVHSYLEPLKEYFDEQNYSQQQLWRAFEVADKAHEGQNRKSGEPYITHPLIVASYLCEYKADEDTILAAIMHDVVEDSATTLKEIRRIFGKGVATLVDGVTKLGNIPKTQNKDVQALRKLFQMMSGDLRMVLIKVFDRLHNMRTLGAMPPHKQERKLKETQNIYIPLAKKLNVWPAVCALEDLCLQYLQPEAFETISQHYEENKSELAAKKQQLKKVFQEKLQPEQDKIQDIVLGRYSFTEVYENKETLENLSMVDTHYVQIIVRNVEDCYSILGSIHNQFRPRHHELRDFLAFPKENGYKAIHTKVFTPYGPINVHIHTQESYTIAHYGELFSAESSKEAQPSSRWINSILDANHDVLNDLSFQSIVQQEILGVSIKVYSIEGEEDELPEGSMVLDYVVMKYPDTFRHIQSIKVNGHKSELSHTLTQNDILDITFSDSPQAIDLQMILHAKQHKTQRILEQHLKGVTLDKVYEGIETCSPWLSYFDISRSLEQPEKYFAQNNYELIHTLNALGNQTLSLEDFFDSYLKLEQIKLLKKGKEVYQFAIDISSQNQNMSINNILEDILKLWGTCTVVPQKLNYKSLKNRLRIKLRFKKLSAIIQLKKVLDSTRQYQHQLIPHFYV